MRALFLCAVFLAVCGMKSWGATIVVPDDVASVSEAVAVASSGDVILLASDSVPLGGPVTIRDKDLVIAGRPDGPRTAVVCETLGPPDPQEGGWGQRAELRTVRIVDSNVVFRRIQIDVPFIYFTAPHITTYYRGAVIEAESGSLAAVDCRLHCSLSLQTASRIVRSEITGYSAITNPIPYAIGSTGDPAVRIHNATGEFIHITDSTIRGDHNAALLLSGLADCRVLAERTSIAGGIEAYYRNAISKTGRDGVFVQDCADCDIAFKSCSVRGTDGGYVYAPFGSGRAPGSGGGNGITVKNSRICIADCHLIGGNGETGYVDYNVTGQTKGGAGGHGLLLENAHARMQNSTSAGGAGGKGWEMDCGNHSNVCVPGDDGLAVKMDENSTLEELSEVRDWELYAG